MKSKVKNQTPKNNQNYDLLSAYLGSCILNVLLLTLKTALEVIYFNPHFRHHREFGRATTMDVVQALGL